MIRKKSILGGGVITAFLLMLGATFTNPEFVRPIVSKVCCSEGKILSSDVSKFSFKGTHHGAGEGFQVDHFCCSTEGDCDEVNAVVLPLTYFVLALLPAFIACAGFGSIGKAAVKRFGYRPLLWIGIVAGLIIAAMMALYTQT